MLLALAPMQDVSDLAMIRTLHRLGTLPDYFITEYFRTTPHHRKLAPSTLSSITENETGVPIYGQLVGSDIPALVRDAQALMQYPVAGVDLNVGCPAPIVTRKYAGAGLLRVLSRLDSTLGALRDALPAGAFTVKCRIGWEDPAEFEQILPILRKHAPDRLAIHARTMAEGYRTPVHIETVRRAVAEMECPVIANGNVADAESAAAWQRAANPAGLMIGRGAVRNPYLFRRLRGEAAPTCRDMMAYALALFEETARLFTPYKEIDHIHRMKKFLVYVAEGLPDDFGHRMRRATTKETLLQPVRDHLDTDTPYPETPPEHSRLIAHVAALKAAAPPPGSAPAP